MVIWMSFFVYLFFMKAFNEAVLGVEDATKNQGVFLENFFCNILSTSSDMVFYWLLERESLEIGYEIAYCKLE